MPIIPKRLRPGDTVGLIAPASAPPDPNTIDKCVDALSAMGFKVKLGRNARKRWGFLAGHDAERAADVMQMFADPKVDGIMCVRGGYGTPRILPLLDYGIIRKNPKAFMGYSDITALHCAFLKHANLLSFHSPMMASEFVHKDLPQFTRDIFMRVITQPVAAGSICTGYKGKTVSVIRGGKVSGELIGGNITLLDTLIGTKFEPAWRGKILFFEDVDERPYRLDRILTHFLNTGLLQQVAGIAIGICAECHDPKAKKGGEFRQSFEDVVRDRLSPLKVPLVMGLPFGHVPTNATVPIGGRVTLDANRGDLIIDEPAVK